LKKIILFFLVCGALTANAQDVLQIKLDGTEQGKTLTAVLGEIEKKNGARFYFLSEWIDQISFQESYKGETLSEALNDLFSGTELRYFSMYPHAVVIIKDPTQPLLRQNAHNRSCIRMQLLQQ
jgi:hypothetical protein